MNIVLFIVAALLIAVTGRATPRTDPPAPPAPIDNSLFDFDRYQRAVSSQNRRLDALESTLGALCALEFAAMTYLLDKTEHSDQVYKLLALAMLVPIILALVGWFGFAGLESPDLGTLDDLLVADQTREGAIKQALSSMAEAYEANRGQIRVKERVRLISVLLAASILVVELTARVVGW